MTNINKLKLFLKKEKFCQDFVNTFLSAMKELLHGKHCHQSGLSSNFVFAKDEDFLLKYKNYETGGGDFWGFIYDNYPDTVMQSLDKEGVIHINYLPELLNKYQAVRFYAKKSEYSFLEILFFVYE